MTWIVESNERLRSGKWEARTPLEFDSESDAHEYVRLVESHPQLNTALEITIVYEKGSR